MLQSKKSLTAIAATLVMLFGVPAALAQGPAQQAQQPPSQQVEVSDAQLAQYVQVAEKVTEIRNDFQQKMTSAEDAEQAQALQEEASAEMIEAVQASGMSVEEYNQVAYALQSDPALQERLAALQS
ncbi:MAG: DUF4168 domain-containing protein [Haliea sp.]